MSETSTPAPRAAQPLIEPAIGSLAGILNWSELDDLWQTILQTADANWYWNELDKPLASTCLSKTELQSAIESLNQYLRASHQQKYCGIVYVDSIDEPTLIRVFDPKTLLSMCNINGYVTPPAWVISRMDPTELAIQETLLAKTDRGDKLPAAPKTTGAHHTLDARRMGCPLPLVHTSRALKGLAIGEVLEVITKEPGSVNDIGSICTWTGQKHVALAEGDYGYSFFVQRKAFQTPPASLTRK